MPDAFFTSTKTRKRKRSLPSKNGPSNSRKKFASKDNAFPKYKKKRSVDEDLDSDRTDGENIDEMDLRAPSEEDDESGEEDPDETQAEKRLRLAKLYIDSVKNDMGLVDGEVDAAEMDKELISSRLKQDVLEHSGKVHLYVADSINITAEPRQVLRTKGHRFSITSAVASTSGKYLFTSGKEGSIIKWNLLSGKKIITSYKIRPPSDTKGKGKGKSDIHGHTDEVWALAVSDDDKYLASGGKDRTVCIWEVESGKFLKGFRGVMGHKDSVSCLSFRRNSSQLFSGSFDRSIKVYDLSPNVMGYVETLFGHQDNILSLDALRSETCMSVGSRDTTARFWKIVDESQLVFRGGGRSRIREVLEGGLRAVDDGDELNKGKREKVVEGSLEAIAMIDETTFITGGDSGSISLWTTQKKKPVFTHPLSHGYHQTGSSAKEPCWITALASLKYSDIFVSGSWDGCIRLWKLDTQLKSFSAVGTMPALGVINSLQLFIPPTTFASKSSWMVADTGHDPNDKQHTVLLVAGLGQEHKFGRWLSVKGSSNCCVVYALPLSSP